MFWQANEATYRIRRFSNDTMIFDEVTQVQCGPGDFWITLGVLFCTLGCSMASGSHTSFSLLCAACKFPFDFICKQKTQVAENTGKQQVSLAAS